MFFTPGILPCCRRIAFLISRPSALTRGIVNDYQMKIMFQWKWPSIYERYPYCFLPSLPRNENYSEIILKRNPNYVLPTLPRGGGTAFPISLCLSRIVPANSKSSLKAIQVVKNIRNWFRLCKIVRPFYSLHDYQKFHAPESLTSCIFSHTEESILLWMQHLVHLLIYFFENEHFW